MRDLRIPQVLTSKQLFFCTNEFTFFPLSKKCANTMITFAHFLDNICAETTILSSKR